MPYKVAFDARTLDNPAGGIGMCLITLAEKLLAEGYSVLFFSDQPRISWEPEHPTHRYTFAFKDSSVGDAEHHWEEVDLPVLIERYQPDIYHAIANTGLPAKANCAKVLTVHDLIPIVFPHSGELKKKAKQDYARSVQRADKILCISESTKQDLIANYPDSEPKITVNYNGVEPLPKTADNQFAHAKPYIVYSAGYDFRKNVDVLVEAFQLLLGMPEFADYSLVLTGAPIIEFDRIKALVNSKKIEKNALFTGYLPRLSLGAVVRDAFCSVTPSGYEGFGLPPLESMTVGCPAIVADNSALSEVVGDSALLLSEISPQAIVDAVQKLKDDDKLRASLIEKGYMQSAKFSWDRNYLTTKNVYSSALLERAAAPKPPVD